MEQDFDFSPVLDRLIQRQEDLDLSMAEISRRAGKGVSYISGIFTEGKVPKLTSFADICSALEISMTYALFGTDLDQDSEEIIRLLSKHPARREGILQILRS